MTFNEEFRIFRKKKNETRENVALHRIQQTLGDIVLSLK